jgi:hypothetical protein
MFLRGNRSVALDTHVLGLSWSTSGLEWVLCKTIMHRNFYAL